jgi:5'-nucleotidase
MRILVTNDDGIDSIGLHILARSMRRFGEVTVVAPDQEYSGAGAAIGAIWMMQPEVHVASVDGIDTAWSVSGPPALCVFFARLEAFGPAPDLIVSGINPGANVGRSVYHSGTIGAAVTGRNGGIPGIAISQSVSDFGVEGQGWEEALVNQKWDVAAAVAEAAVEGILASPTPEAGVLNVNVPNLDLAEIKGWRWTEVGFGPPRAMSSAILEPKVGHEGTFRVSMDWGTAVDPPADSDTAAIMADEISLTWLSRVTALHQPSPAIDAAMTNLR